jgi:hypothetical protein
MKQQSTAGAGLMNADRRAVVSPEIPPESRRLLNVHEADRNPLIVDANDPAA